MSIETELAAIQTGVAIAPLTDRAFLRITGSEATRWLNGMVTNSIQSLAPGEGNYNFLLNAQGRIQADCTIYRDADDFLLETGEWQLETVSQTLDKFIIMDDVELAPAYADESSFLILGPKAPAILQSLGLPTLEPTHLTHVDTPHGPVLLLSTPQGHELRANTAVIAVLTAEANIVPIATEALEAHRILTGTPRFGTDIRDKDLPQETNQTHALHFAKGCYLGQEIVERIRSRGQVHRTFTKFTLEGELPTEFPTPLTANAKPAGELTSAIRIGDTVHALGYIRREALDLKQPITYPGGAAIPAANA